VLMVKEVDLKLLEYKEKGGLKYGKELLMA
jgi:hypothetical protein